MELQERILIPVSRVREGLPHRPRFRGPPAGQPARARTSLEVISCTGISRRPRVYWYPRVYRSPFVYRRPQRRVRVFGCCLPIPLGGLLLTGGGLALAVRRARAGRAAPGR